MTFAATLHASPDDVRITIYSADYVGHARFPATMGDIARGRFAALDTTEDVEDLLREFGTDEDYHRWQALT